MSTSQTVHMQAGLNLLHTKTRKRSAMCLSALFLLATATTAMTGQFGAFSYYVNPGNATVTISRYTGTGGTVIIPDMIESLPVTCIGDHALENTSPTYVTIPNSVTNIGAFAFWQCYTLTGVMIGNGVKNIDLSAFKKCRSLSSVTLPDSVTSLGNSAFDSCTSLTSVVIGNGITSIGSFTFNDCTHLTDVTIGNKVASIKSAAFQSCSYLVNVTLPDSVTSIEDNAFGFCVNLASITIPDNVISIGSSAFTCASSLTSVLLGNSVTSIGTDAFDGCTNLIALTAKALNPAYSSVEGVLFNTDKTTLVQCPGGKAGSYTVPDSVAIIGVKAFYDCFKLKSVTLGNNVTTIGDKAFAIATGMVVGMRPYASLTGIYFKGNAPSLGSAGVFSGSLNATVYHLSGATGWPVVPAVWGSRPTALWQDIPPPPYTYSATNGTISLTGYTGSGGALTIPEMIVGLPVVRIETNAFASCTNLTSVVIGTNVTSIGDSAFDSCTGLTNVTLLSSGGSSGAGAALSVRIGKASLGSEGGGTLADSPVKGTCIGNLAFASCTNLTCVMIGNGVTNIGNAAFSNCTSLTEIYFKGTVPSVGSDVFFGDGQVTVYYLPGTAGWSEITTLGGRPVMPWVPSVQADISFGVRTNQFGFNITWPKASGMAVVVEANTNLTGGTWIPLQTNTLSSDTSSFSDPQWTNYPARFYRLRLP